MKQSKLTTKILVAVLILGVVIYFIFYFIQSFSYSLVTSTAYSATINIGTEANGIVIRDESVITASGNYIDLIPGEGEKVAKGESVAVIYSDSSGLETSQAISTLEAEIEKLSQSLSSGTDVTDTSKLDESVLNSIVNIRALSASDDLSTLEDSALNLRAMVFRRDYTYGDSSVATGLSSLIAEKESELASLESSLSRVTTYVTAPSPGIFSGVADGYETLITPDSVLSMSPSALNALMYQSPMPPSDAVGKLITSSTWYFAALLDYEDAVGLRLDQTYQVSFSYDWFGDVDMTLEWVSDKENDQVIALFSAKSHLSDTTLLRKQTVDIVTDQLTGIRIPRRALRVVTEEVTDSTTGETTEVQYTGVYTVIGTRAEFQKVNVLYTDDNFYLVEPVDPDATHRLRAGDEVILNTRGIYDGKVVR